LSEKTKTELKELAGISETHLNKFESFLEKLQNETEEHAGHHASKGRTLVKLQFTMIF